MRIWVIIDETFQFEQHRLFFLARLTSKPDLVYNLGVMKSPVDPEFVQQEQDTIASMTRIYCRSKHRKSAGLCPQCQELLDYAHERVSRCMFLPDKPVCARCPVHCYQATYRERVREVMRFAGPRLIFKDPAAVVRHFRMSRRADSEQVARLRNKLANK